MREIEQSKKRDGEMQNIYELGLKSWCFPTVLICNKIGNFFFPMLLNLLYLEWILDIFPICKVLGRL